MLESFLPFIFDSGELLCASEFDHLRDDESAGNANTTSFLGAFLPFYFDFKENSPKIGILLHQKQSVYWWLQHRRLCIYSDFNEYSFNNA